MDHIDKVLAELKGQMYDQEPVTAVNIEHQVEDEMRGLMEYGFQPRCDADFRAMAEYCAKKRLGVTKKGLFITGKVGNGKTLAVKYLRAKFYSTRDLVEIFKNYSKKWHTLRYGEHYDFADRRECRHIANLTIDDLGVEPTQVDYGTKDEVVNELIEKRYKLFIEQGLNTNFTTNMPIMAIGDQPGIEERYGERTMDRIKEMCEMLAFIGESQR